MVNPRSTLPRTCVLLFRLFSTTIFTLLILVATVVFYSKSSQRNSREFFFFFIKETFMHIWSKRKEGPCAATYLRERLLSLANDQGPNLDAFASRKRQVFLFRERSFLSSISTRFSVDFKPFK